MSNTIYVEYANRAFSGFSKEYEILMQSILSYPDPNQEQFNIEIYPSRDKGSNTYSLFIYGYEININLELFFIGDNEFLGKILCRSDSDQTLCEFYIDSNGSLLKDKDATFRTSGYLGQCDKMSTATKFLIVIAKKLIEKNSHIS